MSTFFISDLHLDHANIIRYCGRPFRSVREMNRALVRSWNDTVGDDDEVYFLGDLTFGRGSRGVKYWLDRLNGRITFIRGSHDRPENGIEMHEVLVREFSGTRFVLIHNPHDFFRSVKILRLLGASSALDSVWVIHGHVHNNRSFIVPEDRTINVSVEVLGYRPISLDEVLAAVRRSLITGRAIAKRRRCARRVSQL